MMKMARFFSLLCLIFLMPAVFCSELDVDELGKDEGVHVNVTETEKARKETVSISVQLVDIDRYQDGKFKDAREIRVSYVFSDLSLN